MSKFGPDEDLIRRLSDLLKETGLNEMEYEAEGQRIRLSRGGGATYMAPPPAPALAAPRVPAEAAAGAGGDAIPAGAIVSPMVGTAYLSPEPGAATFVKVGDTVKEGQTLLIIEAMKVMNQIPSPRSGRVTQVLAEEGQPVEYGEPLMVVE